MKRESISEAVGGIGEKYVAEAANYDGMKTSILRRKSIAWASAAACLALVIALGTVIIIKNTQKRYVATLEDGSRLCFEESGGKPVQKDTALRFTTRDLTREELNGLFGEREAEAYALFDAESKNILGIEGSLDGMKLVVSKPDTLIVDTIIDENESEAVINGVKVNTACHTEEKMITFSVIYIDENGNKVFLELTGVKGDADDLCQVFAVEICDVIENVDMNIDNIGE